MCMVVAEAVRRSVSRRTFLKSAGALAAAPLVLDAASRAVSRSFDRVARAQEASQFHTQVVLLGTAGGPVWWPGTNRVGTSSALDVGGSIYLIDLGDGSTHRLNEAFNTGVFINTPGGKVERGNPTFIENVNALFFTHLHSDHTVEYPALLNFGHGVGLNPSKPLKVFGPGPRGELEVIFTIPGAPPRSVPVINPSNPNPGTVGMTNYLFQAFAQTMNNFMRDIGWPDFTAEFDVHDITLPTIPGFVDANTTPSPPMKPFSVYQDNLVSVQATLVSHGQVFPAFAYRLDTNDGSVVFSGDTSPNDNLIQMAQGADILVHEVIDPDWINNLIPPPLTPGDEALLHHLQTAHTTIQDVGKVAQATGVKTLVLNHIVPGNDPIAHLLQASQNFSGHLIVGEDLLQVGVGTPASSARTKHG